MLGWECARVWRPDGLTPDKVDHAHRLYGGCFRRFSNARSFRPSARSISEQIDLYWVNSQRQSGAPAKRLGYTGIAFYDLSNPYHPRFFWPHRPGPWKDSGRHVLRCERSSHGFLIAGRRRGDPAPGPSHDRRRDRSSEPKNSRKMVVPRQKTPEEDAIRNSTVYDLRRVCRKAEYNRLVHQFADQSTRIASNGRESPLHRCPPKLKGEILRLSRGTGRARHLDVRTRATPSSFRGSTILRPALQAATRFRVHAQTPQVAW